MIDWFNVFTNALWIFGLAMALAALSYARWEAALQHRRLWEVLDSARWQRRLNLAGGFFAAGLAATSAHRWEQALWAAFCFWFLINAFRSQTGEQRNNS